jgi:hypothetical protein
LLGGDDRRRSACYDNFDSKADELRREFRKSIEFTIGPSELDDDVFPLDVTEFS